MTEAGFDTEAFECDISSRESIKNLINNALEYGEITKFINTTGVSPSKAQIEATSHGIIVTPLALDDFNDFQLI